MSNLSSEVNLENMNKNLHMTIDYLIRGITNEVIASAAFVDRNNPSKSLDSDSIKPEYLVLLNDIEEDIKRHIRNNINSFDFSTYDSASNSINSFLTAFLSKEENEKFVNMVLNHEKGTFLFMASAVILYREASSLAFVNSHYHVAIRLYGLCRDLQSQIQFTNKQFMENFKQELSRRNKKPNEARWKGHVEQLRRKYLKLDEHRQDEIGEYLTINDATTWIYINHNKEKLKFDTIRDHLSKARKGIFTNK